MTILVVGATGKTGGPLVEQLLGMNYKVRVIVRSCHKLPAEVLGNPNTTVRGGLVCLNSAARFDKWNRAAVR